MHRVVNLRGTSGSGKTYVARKLLMDHSHEELRSNGRIMGYCIDASSSGIRTPVFLVGSYATTCGGLDNVNTQEEAADRIVKAHAYGHVLAEGLLVSKSGPSGHLSPRVRALGGSVFAFLDTPLELCIRRVEERRKAAGNLRPFDPDRSLSYAHRQCIRCAELLELAKGYDVRWVDHRHAYEQVVYLFHEADRQEGIT